MDRWVTLTVPSLHGRLRDVSPGRSSLLYHAAQKTVMVAVAIF